MKILFNGKRNVSGPLNATLHSVEFACFSKNNIVLMNSTKERKKERKKETGRY
jgi:hypothetical protein